MKKFVFKCETIRGGDEFIAVEGTTESEARSKFNQPNVRFVADIESKISFNVNNLIKIELIRIIDEPPREEKHE